jgi:NADH-quinone oxidoreductase subunit J
MNGTMNPAFYLASVIALAATLRALTQLSAIRALLYLIVSFLSVAVIFYILGAPFAAALEVITYAGAIMVLFVFAVMILNLGPISERQEKLWRSRGIWIEPVVFAALLLIELIYAMATRVPQEGQGATTVVGPKAVGIALFGPYVLGVELASVLLLAGLAGAYRLGHKKEGA